MAQSLDNKPTLGAAALLASAGLLLMVVLAPIALTTLDALTVPTDGLVQNIAGSMGSFRGSIAAMLVVAFLDIAVAWAVWLLLRPISEGAATLVACLRLVYTAVLVVTVSHLLDAAQLVDGGTALAPELLTAQVSLSIAAFRSQFAVGLSVFGLHLISLGLLLSRSTLVPRWLAALVVVAGAGYTVDSFGTILFADYTLGVARFTFVGEALLIFWFGYRGFRPGPAAPGRA